MQICRSKADMRALRTQWQSNGQPVALVPTMGALHQGHLTLVTRARDWVQAQGGGRVVTSIFVDPTQFGPNEDLEKYPRNEAGDIALLEQAGADAVFLPPVAEIYRPGAQTIVEVTDLSRILMGRLRPGHFRGVATIVTKLFNIVQPGAACFGEKDYQQLLVIRQMVADLDVPVQILGVPTVREADGLAMSSRNQRLTPEDRAEAPVLARALDDAAQAIAGGISVAALKRRIAARLAGAARGIVRSIDIRGAADLAPLSGRIDQPAVILLAVAFGDVLLIDQRVAHPG